MSKEDKFVSCEYAFYKEDKFRSLFCEYVLLKEVKSQSYLDDIKARWRARKLKRLIINNSSITNKGRKKI